MTIDSAPLQDARRRMRGEMDVDKSAVRRDGQFNVASRVARRNTGIRVMEAIVVSG